MSTFPTETRILETRIPEGRELFALQYGSHVQGSGWSGYHVRVRDLGLDAWGIARETSAADELVGDDTAIVDAIEEELGLTGTDAEAGFADARPRPRLVAEDAGDTPAGEPDWPDSDAIAGTLSGDLVTLLRAESGESRKRLAKASAIDLMRDVQAVTDLVARAAESDEEGGAEINGRTIGRAADLSNRLVGLALQLQETS